MLDATQITTFQLQAFLAICETGSFSKAAMSLDIAQPTISGRVRSLERALGGPLFVRRGRGVELSVRGEAFRSYAERSLAVLSEGLLASRLGVSGPVGRVVLGVSDSALADSFLGAAVARLSQTHPTVEIVAEMTSCTSLIEALQDGVYALALMPWPYAGRDSHTLKPLLRFREHLRLVVSATHPLAGRASTMDEVCTLASPFLRLWWNQDSRRQLEALADLPEPTLEVPIQVARHTLLQGRGAALLAPSVIAHELAAGSLVTLDVADLPTVPCESALVVHESNGDLPPMTRAFIDAVQTEAGPLCVPNGD